MRYAENKLRTVEHKNRFILQMSCVLLLCLAAACEPAAAQSYTITDLGTLGGSNSTGYAINASGQVVGSAATATQPFGHAFVISPPYTSMTDLGAILVDYSFAAAINASGQVTGGSYDVFVTSPPYTSLTDLGTFGGVWGSTGGYSINDSGQITGWSFLTGSGPLEPYHAFLAAPPYGIGGLIDLGTLGGSSSSGHGINASGQITGSSMTTNDAGRHAFVMSAPYTTMVDLGTLAGTVSDGFAINDSGQITGESFAGTVNNYQYHAFLISPPYSSMVDLGTLGGTYSGGYCINNLGQVAGISYTADGSQHAFLYTTANGMVDLNTLLPSGSGWTLVAAYGINDAGQITGYGTNPNGEQHAFVLTPPPSNVTPGQMVTNLIATVQSMRIPKQGTSLMDQLQQVESDITTQNRLACQDLNAFMQHVRAQAGNAITILQAEQLMAAALSIKAALNCGP